MTRPMATGPFTADVMAHRVDARGVRPAQVYCTGCGIRASGHGTFVTPRATGLSPSLAAGYSGFALLWC
jgi:hypothetical protein